MTAALETANRRVEALEAELDSLAYGISHDLRSPLRAIVGFAQILQEEQAARLDTEGMRHLQVIRDSGRKLEQLIEGLLAYSRVGRQPMQWGRVDMNALARRALQTALGTQAKRSREIILHELPEGEGDSDLLFHVWNTYFANALTYTDRTPEPHIEIGGHAEPQQRIWYVRDNGAGFDMRYAAKLFGMFQRLHSQEEFPGLGTSLAIARRIVNRHGGRTWAEGSAQQGACFYFALPGPTV